MAANVSNQTQQATACGVGTVITQRRDIHGSPPSYAPARNLNDQRLLPYQLYRHESPFKLHLGGTLPSFEIAYESWGTLNDKKDNVILLTTGLSASSHAKSHFGNRSDGWWEKFIGPGLPLDTNKFHIICTNVIGGCYGSTGPSSIDPVASKEAGRSVRYGINFPMVTVWDMVRAQFRLLDHLGVNTVHAVVGSSMGGMQSLAAAALFPDRVQRAVSISAAARSHPYSIALRHAQRQVLMSDPNWMGGNYYEHGVIPEKGLSLARQIGTITYRSGPEWEMRFGRKRANPKSKPGLQTDFMIESYLQHQGNKWIGKYDANSLIFISRAMDMFDMTERPLFDPNLQNAPVSDHEDSAELLDEKATTDYMHTQYLTEGMSTIKCPTLVIGVKSDFLIPSWQQMEIATCLKAAGNKKVSHFEIDGVFGHDTFLLDFSNVGSAVKGHLEIPFPVLPTVTTDLKQDDSPVELAAKPKASSDILPEQIVVSYSNAKSEPAKTVKTDNDEEIIF
ncbi:homoserine O-acetyltransferase [Obelidium mucronatum]|nr:homoserine O-acetyltransferase [Obelidium mucronatum]